MAISQGLDTDALKDIFPSPSPFSKDLGWVNIAGACALGFGREGQVISLCDFIVQETKDRNENNRLHIFRKLREALLKAGPVVGIPRTINGLGALSQYLRSNEPGIATRLESDKSLREPVSLPERRKRGQDFFDRIYARHSQRVLKTLDTSSGGDLSEFAISSVYGGLLAEFTILDAKETGLLEFVCCLSLGAAPQTKGHMHGAHNLGNSDEEIQAAIEVVELIAKQLGVSWTGEHMDFLRTPKDHSW